MKAKPHNLISQGKRPKKAYDDKDAIQRKYLALSIAHEKLKKFVREEMSK